ncbi:MAG TPA: hypothetical protein VMK65_01395 [Longimicrobiales bacterium]|nr:hypothetical protein [Longimicrobiales bacterium]
MEERNAGTTGAEGDSRGAGEKVKDKAHQAQEKVSELTADAREKGEHLVEEGKEKTQELMHRAEAKARSRADEEKDRVAGGIRTVADALRRGGEELPEDQRGYGRFVDNVANRVDGVSHYLETHDVDDLTREVNRFARDHTPAFLSGAFALGLMGARFLKSSGDEARRERERYPVSRGYPGGVGYGTTSGYPGSAGEREYPRRGYEQAEPYHAGDTAPRESSRPEDPRSDRPGGGYA